MSETPQEEVVLEDLDIEDIEYQGKSLAEWEDEFTVQLPAIPCNSQQITQAMVDLSNKYQIAYNCYNSLMILCSKAESAFKTELDKLCTAKATALKAGGLSRMPSRDNLEGMVIGDDKNKKLIALLTRFHVYSSIKIFFENNKTKLGKCMDLAKDISYSVNASEKVYGQIGDKGRGL